MTDYLHAVSSKNKTMRQTMELRWAVPDETTTKPPELQRAWQCIETGEIEWVAIPTVVVRKVGEA